MDLQYAPFPDVSRAIPELAARLATRLAKVEEAPKATDDDSLVLPPASVVGARGFEPWQAVFRN